MHSPAKHLFALYFVVFLILLHVSAMLLRVTTFPLTDYDLYATYRTPSDIVLYRVRVTEESGEHYFLRDDTFAYHSFLEKSMDPELRGTQAFLVPHYRHFPLIDPSVALTHIAHGLSLQPKKLELVRVTTKKAPDGTITLHQEIIASREL